MATAGSICVPAARQRPVDCRLYVYVLMSNYAHLLMTSAIAEASVAAYAFIEVQLNRALYEQQRLPGAYVFVQNQ